VDYLRFTVPQSDKHSTLSAVTPFLDSIGAADDGVIYRGLSGGTMSTRDAYQVTAFQFTGALLDEIRSHGLWVEFLTSIAVLPRYRLTQTHLTVDVSYPGWLYVPTVYEQARQGRLKIGQRFDFTKDVKQYFSPSHYSPSHDTGTVYLGSRKAERRLKVYDKAQERFENRGYEISPTTRLEIELSSKTGVTLRDVFSPLECFYFHVPHEVITPPKGLKGWKRTEAIGGYTCERKESPTAYQRATMLVESIEPVLKSIRKLAMENPEKSEAFTELILSKIRRQLGTA
jgi:hypothetical protein